MSSPRGDPTTGGLMCSKWAPIRATTSSIPSPAPKIASVDTQTAVSTITPRPRWSGPPAALPPIPAGLPSTTPLAHQTSLESDSETKESDSPVPIRSHLRPIADPAGLGLQYTREPGITVPPLPSGFRYSNPEGTRDTQGWPLDGSAIVATIFATATAAPTSSASQQPSDATATAKATHQKSKPNPLGTRPFLRIRGESKKAGTNVDEAMPDSIAHNRFNLPAAFLNNPRGPADVNRRWVQPAPPLAPAPSFAYQRESQLVSGNRQLPVAAAVDRPAPGDSVMGKVKYYNIHQMVIDRNIAKCAQHSFNKKHAAPFTTTSDEPGKSIEEAEAENSRKQALRAEFHQNYISYYKDPSLLAALSKEDRSFFTEVETDRILDNVDREVREDKERKLQG